MVDLLCPRACLECGSTGGWIEPPAMLGEGDGYAECPECGYVEALHAGPTGFQGFQGFQEFQEPLEEVGLVVSTASVVDAVGAAGALGFSYPGVRVTEGHLVLPEGLPYEEWVGIGQTLKSVERNIQWMLGDWLRYGARKYGDMYTQALDGTPYEYGTLATMKWVAERVSPEIRDPEVPFSHYREIAPIMASVPERAMRIIETAKAEGLTSRQVKREVAKVKYEVAREALSAHAARETLDTSPATFPVIAAVPPWGPDFGGVEQAELAPGDHLTVSQLSEAKIGGRPIAALGTEHSLLILWCPNTRMEAALSVMKAWGYAYLTNIALLSDVGGEGYYTDGRHSLALIGKRGHFPAPAPLSRPDSVLREEPGAAVERLADCYAPHGTRRLGLFMRAYGAHWESYPLV